MPYGARVAAAGEVEVVGDKVDGEDGQRKHEGYPKGGSDQPPNKGEAKEKEREVLLVDGVDYPRRLGVPEHQGRKPGGAGG
ncbi:MAG: hypothetical protein DDT34_01554 [Firmicutes bacterium]|nr:hypothetical protein [Bacillota bacterium]